MNSGIPEFLFFIPKFIVFIFLTKDELCFKGNNIKYIHTHITLCNMQKKFNFLHGKLLILTGFIIIGLTVANAADYDESPFQDNQSFQYYSLESDFFSESYIENTPILRAPPGDLEEGENGLGLPVEGKEIYIFSSFAILYFLFIYCRKQYSRQNKQLLK